MQPIDVLISLHQGYGLGDAVQMSSVLRHVAKHRPHWRFDFQAEEGRHQVGRGMAQRTFAFGANPQPDKWYDAEVQLLLFDTWANWHDRPNTRVSSVLYERLGMGWDADCGRYSVEVSRDARAATAALVARGDHYSKGSDGNARAAGKTDKGRFVALHYRGDSSPERKDLTHAQAEAICTAIERRGCSPLVIDWRGQSPIPQRCGVRTTGGLPVSRLWGADAEYNCAVIGHCAAFVGIDSGPSKCASATDTPALVVWTGHHPSPFHDPAPNTTHLVPRGYHGLAPVCGDLGVVQWFESHYKVRFYDRDPVSEVAAWLAEVLRR